MVADARDHNHGVSLVHETTAYRTTHGKSLQFFRKLWSHPVVKSAVVEADQVRQNWRTDRSGDRTWFDRMHELHTMEHARQVVAKVDGDAHSRRASAALAQ